jgi:hypothetical protein
MSLDELLKWVTEFGNKALQSWLHYLEPAALADLLCKTALGAAAKYVGGLLWDRVRPRIMPRLLQLRAAAQVTVARLTADTWAGALGEQMAQIEMDDGDGAPTPTEIWFNPSTKLAFQVQRAARRFRVAPPPCNTDDVPPYGGWHAIAA